MSIASIKTFLKGLEHGVIDTSKKRIYNFIKLNNKCTISDIHFNLCEYKISTITARVSDLCDLGVIKYNGEFQSKKGSFSKIEIVESEDEQKKLYVKRDYERTIRNINSLIKNSGHNLRSETIDALKKELQ